MPPRLPALLACTAALGASSMTGCASSGGEPFSPSPRPTAAFQEVPYATWNEREPGYRMYPGDVLDVATPSAPELNRSVTVQPDGRISLPLIQPVMAGDRTVAELRTTLSQAYASQLINPAVEVTVRTASPLKVFIGGQVDKPGTYDMPGDIDALQAVVLAGGFKIDALRNQVVVIRRGPGGRAMMRVVDLRTAVFDPARGNGAVPLRRFDIVYVPRTRIAEVGLFVQQYARDILPIQFSYAINGFSGG